MIAIDSWILIEFFFRGPKHERADRLLEGIQHGEAAVMSPLAIAETKYRIAKKLGMEKARHVIHEIVSFPNIKILPVSIETAILAADLRYKYYHGKTRPLSLADCIHLATALMSKCDVLYSGDPDFKGIEEIKTVVV